MKNVNFLKSTFPFFLVVCFSLIAFSSFGQSDALKAKKAADEVKKAPETILDIQTKADVISLKSPDGEEIQVKRDMKDKKFHVKGQDKAKLEKMMKQGKDIEVNDAKTKKKIDEIDAAPAKVDKGRRGEVILHSKKQDGQRG